MVRTEKNETEAVFFQNLTHSSQMDNGLPRVLEAEGDGGLVSDY